MKYIFGIVCALLIAAPGVTQAYQVIDSSATKLNDTTYLFTIDYQLGFEKYDVLAPIGVVRSGEADTPYLNYALTQDEDENLIGGQSAALVLSTAQVRGAEYFVPKGEARRFTLFALLSFNDAPELNELQLQVTKLPFKLATEELTQQNGLSQGELQSYITPKVE
jgi:hypothetical protein